MSRHRRNGGWLLRFEILILAAVAVTAFSMAAGTSHAEAANTRPCVTSGEHKQIRFDMPKRKVHRIFDFNGVTSNLWPRTRAYRWCNGDATTYVIYHRNNPVRVKSVLWLSSETA